jgi:Ca2+-binding EF-hand superfamily protein
MRLQQCMLLMMGLVVAGAVVWAVEGGDTGKGGGDRKGGMRPPPSPLLMVLDTDKDGALSADEIANAPEALKKLDKDGDGVISHEELRPRMKGGEGPGAGGQKPPEGAGKDGPPPPPLGEEDGKRPPHGAPPLIRALDTDKNGELSDDEIANAAEALKKLDRNGDGKLDMQELRPKPPEGEEGQGPRPPRGPHGKKDGTGGEAAPVQQNF